MDITHLLHWENAESFTVIQAAHLIRGLDPSLNGEYDESKVQHIIEVMRRAYAHAKGCCANLMTKGGYGYSEDKPREYPLFSIDLYETEKQNLHKACFFGNAGDKLDWLNPANNQNLNFDNQHFYHYQVANWLKGSRTHSVYPFDACFVDDRGSYVDESQIQPARLLTHSEVLDLFPLDTPAPAIKPASPAPVVVPANTTPPSTSEAEFPHQRQDRRYQMCVDAGLVMPTNEFSRLPRGIGKIAKMEGIRTPSFTEDVKAHITRINKA